MKKNPTKLPTAVRALPAELRGKALALAATLRERGVAADKALEMSATRTSMWARHRASQARAAARLGHDRPRSEATPRNRGRFGASGPQPAGRPRPRPATPENA